MAAMATTMTLSAVGLRKPFVPARNAVLPARTTLRCFAQLNGEMSSSSRHSLQKAAPVQPQNAPVAEQTATENDTTDMPNGMLMLAALLTPLLLDAEPASANQFLTGKTVSLVHPTVMFTLLGVTLYTGLLGWNYRQARLIPAEVKELKGQLPTDDEAKAASPLQSQIKELETKRKDLLKGDPRGKHYLWSSLLLGMGTTFAVVGPLNTFLRTGKLFPGPHLYAGATMIALWGIAAAMTPLMSRNNDLARNVHIGANVVNTGLFVWQVPTGIEIVLKVFEFASWP